MKKLLIIILAFLTVHVYAQHEDQIRTDIATYNQAFLEGDMDKYVSYSIQSVIQMGGGAELMKDVATEQAKLLVQSDSKILSLDPTWFSDPYQSEGAIHVVVGQQHTMKIGSSTFVKTAYYLAESVDEGNSWSFIDLEAYDKAALGAYIPGISQDIVLPEPDAAIKVEE